MYFLDPEVERVAKAVWREYCERIMVHRERRKERMDRRFEAFMGGLLNRPLERPWREQLDAFQEQCWQEIGLRLTPESCDKVAARIQVHLNDPRCLAYVGPQAAEPAVGGTQAQPAEVEQLADEAPVVLRKQLEGEALFDAKLAEAAGFLAAMRQILESLGNRLDAAALDEELDVEADIEAIETLIWRYNNVIEEAGDLWLREDLSSQAYERLSAMNSPLSLDLQWFLDEDQAERARRQTVQISNRLGYRIGRLNKAVTAVRALDTINTAAGLVAGGTLFIVTVKQGGRAIVKLAATAAVAYLIDQGAEKALRAAGAGDKTVSVVRLAAAVVTLILLRRKARGRKSGTARNVVPPNRGIWGLTPQDRWTIVEERLGKNLPGNFPVIDKFENGVVTSIKSLDLGAKTYQRPSVLASKIRGYIDAVANIKIREWNNVRIDASQIRGRQVELAIPPDGTREQRAVLNEVAAYGQEVGVALKVVEMW